MGKRKYNAPEDPKQWVPIATNNIQETCKHLVRNKCLYGCILDKFLKLWKKEEKFIKSCQDCNEYERKEEPKKSEKKTRKTKGIKGKENITKRKRKTTE